MSVDAFTCRFIAETIDGLCDGLSHFSDPSRSAVIYALLPHDPVYIYDSHHLLDGYEPKFKELYLCSNDWRINIGISNDREKFSHMLPEKNLQLAGLISYGGRSIPGEDRSRGARYNSALRFTAEHDNIIVVVVSSDRPVSIIKEGVELSAQCQWKPVSGYITKPVTLEAWIAESGL